MTSTYKEILESKSPLELEQKLKEAGCSRCSLSEHDNQIVVARGNCRAEVMLIGEAPGAQEDRIGKPFMGPAGQLMDQAFKCVGIDTDKDLYISNVCLCRPVAPKGSGRENYTPKTNQQMNCLPYVRALIELVKPQILVACGAVAAKALCGLKDPMGKIAGKFSDWAGYTLYVMYHPAYVLHSKAKGTEEYEKVKRLYWEQVKALRSKIDEMGIPVSNIVTA